MAASCLLSQQPHRGLCVVGTAVGWALDGTWRRCFQCCPWVPAAPVPARRRRRVLPGSCCWWLVGRTGKGIQGHSANRGSEHSSARCPQPGTDSLAPPGLVLAAVQTCAWLFGKPFQENLAPANFYQMLTPKHKARFKWTRPSDSGQELWAAGNQAHPSMSCQFQHLRDLVKPRGALLKASSSHRQERLPGDPTALSPCGRFSRRFWLKGGGLLEGSSQ